MPIDALKTLVAYPCLCAQLICFLCARALLQVSPILDSLLVPEAHPRHRLIAFFDRHQQSQWSEFSAQKPSGRQEATSVTKATVMEGDSAWAEATGAQYEDDWSTDGDEDDWGGEEWGGQEEEWGGEAALDGEQVAMEEEVGEEKGNDEEKQKKEGEERWSEGEEKGKDWEREMGRAQAAVSSDPRSSGSPMQSFALLACLPRRCVSLDKESKSYWAQWSLRDATSNRPLQHSFFQKNLRNPGTVRDASVPHFAHPLLEHRFQPLQREELRGREVQCVEVKLTGAFSRGTVDQKETALLCKRWQSILCRFVNDGSPDESVREQWRTFAKVLASTLVSVVEEALSSVGSKSSITNAQDLIKATCRQMAVLTPAPLHRDCELRKLTVEELERREKSEEQRQRKGVVSGLLASLGIIRADGARGGTELEQSNQGGLLFGAAEEMGGLERPLIFVVGFTHPQVLSHRFSRHLKTGLGVGLFEIRHDFESSIAKVRESL